MGRKWFRIALFQYEAEKFVSLGNVIPDAEKCTQALVTDSGEIWLLYADSPNVICFKFPAFSTSTSGNVKLEKSRLNCIMCL